MCRFSGSDWLFQKSVAWLKWSKNFSPRSRIFCPLERLRVRDEAAHRAAGLERAAAADRVRVVGGLAGVDGLAHEAVALVVVQRRHRPVDRDLVEVGAAEPRELRVGVGEQAPLQQRIVA